MLRYLLFFHVASVLAFFAAHGTSMGVMHALRREYQPDRIRALLDVSLNASVWSWNALVAVVVSGTWLGFAGGYWQDLWLWASVGILAVTALLMALLAVRYYGALRIAAGLRPHRRTVQIPAPLAFDRPRFSQAIAQPYPTILTIAGTVSTLTILWLMMFQPF